MSENEIDYKFYFIYSQKGKKSNISILETNDQIKKIDIIASGIQSGKIDYLYQLYCLNISNIQEDKPITLSLISIQGELYTAKIYLHNKELFKYKIIFEPYYNKNENSLNQIVLPFHEQFEIFKKHLKIDNELLYNLYSSQLNVIFTEKIIEFDFLLKFFIELYEQYQSSLELKNIIKSFFENINLKQININQQNKDMDISSNKYNFLLNPDKIRNDLITITNNKEKINEKIDILLGYYYYFYNQKLFISFISNKNKEITANISKHLIFNRHIFNNFDYEIMKNLLDDAENISQIKSLMRLFVNMVECFHMLGEYNFYVKLSCLVQIENSAINIMELNKLQKNDDIQSLYNYFKSYNNYCEKEQYCPVVLNKDFFIEYCKLFVNKDLEKINILIQILELYNKNLDDKFKIKIEEELNKYYFKTGIYLINTQSIINKDLINFIKVIPKNIEVDKDAILNAIILDGKDSEFLNNFLNDSFKDFKLVDYFGDNYFNYVKKKFDECVLPKNLLFIMDWEIADLTKKQIIEIFINAVRRIWLNDPENYMFGLEKVIANGLGKASILVFNYKKYIYDLEKNISNKKIIRIYSELLHNNYKVSSNFKDHIINYINENKGNGPLSLWYTLNTIDDKNNKYNFLYLNLRDNYAIKKEDFVQYMNGTNERILLFANLFNDEYFESSFIDTKYYKESMKAKDHLEDLPFKDVMVICKNMDKLHNILSFFFPPDNQDDDQNDNIYLDLFIIDFSEKCGLARNHYNSLKTVLTFWNRFFPEEKKIQRNNLKNMINVYENSPLTSFNSLYNETISYLDFLIEAKESEKLFRSIFFREIYNKTKTELNSNNERNIYSNAILKFNELKKLGKVCDINTLDKDLIDTIVNSAYKNIGKLNDELNFIESYFNFNSKDNIDYNNFDFIKLKNDIINLVIPYQKVHGLYNFNPDDHIDYNEDEEEDNNKDNQNNDNNFNIIADDDDDDDNEFSLFGKEEQKPKNIIIDNDNNQIIEQKNNLLTEISTLSNSYFSISRKFSNNKEDMNYLNGEAINELKELNESFIKFYIKIFETNHNFAKLSNKEFYDNIISLSNKIFINATNLGLFINLDKSNNKKGLILISQFNDVIETFTIQRAISKGILFRLLQKFLDCYNKKELEAAQTLASLDNLFSEINENIQNEKLVSLLIELLIKERKKIENDKELVKFILRDGASNFYYLYKDLIPIINEIMQEDIIYRFQRSNNNNTDGFVTFNLGLMTQINEKCQNSKDFKEMMLFYFETKIMDIFNETYHNENEINMFRDEKMKNLLKQCFDFLEREYKGELGNKANKTISILFCIAYIKCFLNKLINCIYTNYQDTNDLNQIFNAIIKGNAINSFRTTFKLYVFKLIFDKADNYFDFSNKNLSINYQINYRNDEDIKKFLETNVVESYEKYYGFDFMIIPNTDKNDKNFIFMIKELNSIKERNINNEINDEDLINAINKKYDFDEFFCTILNLHFSFFYSKNYLISNEFIIINKWLEDKINNQEINILAHNELIKKIFNFFSKKLVQDNNNIYSYNQILCLCISARYVLSTLLLNKGNGLYYNIIIDIKNVIKNYLNYFKYYLIDYNTFNKMNRDINYLTYKIINYVILSHLYFGYILGNISLEDINKLLSIELKEEEEKNKNINYILDLLFKEFNFIKNDLLKFIGINKIILFMNCIFTGVSQKILKIQCNNEDNVIRNNEEELNREINKNISNFNTYVKDYYNYVKEFDNSNNNIYINILFEKNDYYTTTNEKEFPFISYLTATNFCTFDDFKNQFLFFTNGNEKNNYPLINCILQNDDIMEIIKCIPPINCFINSVYNELALKLSKDDLNKKIKDVLPGETLSEIQIFNEAITIILKYTNNIKINFINEESEISEIINLPNNFINKLYEEIIKIYNQFIQTMKIYTNNKDVIEPIIIQNATENDYITFYKINNDESPTPINERLLDIIQLYSKRNRSINSEIITYNGGKIVYNFELIENELEKEFIYGKKIFEENQQFFIFSNEIYSGDRNNILLELSNKYEQVKIKEKYIKEIEEYLDKLQIIDVTDIYYNLQSIIIYLMTNEKNNKYDSNMKINDLVKIMAKSNFEINPAFNSFIKQFYDMLFLNNLLHLNQEIECRVFYNLTEMIDIDKNKMEINETKKNEIENDLNVENKLITKDILIDAIKKYILRYCINDHQNNKDILNKYKNMDDIINKKDIWEETVVNDSRFKKECNELKTINTGDNYLLKYCYNILFDKSETQTDGPSDKVDYVDYSDFNAFKLEDD